MFKAIIESSKTGLLAFVFGLSFIAISSSALAETPKKGGTLVVGFTVAPRSLNPAVQSGAPTGLPGTQLFASPLRYDENWNPQPYLATSWETSEDGLALTLRLRENATFHDGKPVTSEDVAFSLMAIKEHHPFKAMFEPVEGVDTPDAHTAIIRLSRPHPAIMLALSPALSPILPKHIYGDGQPLKTHPMNLKPVGSGPFKFVEYAEGKHLVLERYDDYFLEGLPHLDRIIYKYNQDSSSQSLEMERGDLDVRALVGKPRELQRHRKNKSLTVTDEGHAAIGVISWLAFNLNHEILRHKDVRQAIAYAIDLDFIDNALYGGFATPASGPISMDSPLADQNPKLYNLDLDKANKMLDDAGYPRNSEGVRFGLTLDMLGSMRIVGEYIKPQLKKVGIDIELRIPPDFSTWSGWVANHDFDMTLDIVFNWADPVIGVNRTFMSTNINKGVIWSNTQSYSNPKVDELLEAGAVELDSEKRKELYAEFQQIVTEELPVYWINKVPYHTVYNNRVKHTPESIWGLLSPFDEVYLD
tara:strand:- start:9712 stop:11298 length:1587 start_codon:yes stop_codon:yes gene_type:complete